MKKIIATLGALVFALAIGSAFADPSTEQVMPSDMSSYSFATNGITLLDTGPGCSIAEGAAAGGLAYDTPGLILQNGVTGFSEEMSSVVARNGCAETELSSGPSRDNGVTIFDTSPIAAN